jgi:3-hydroxyacyl-CoA dehydrogenase
MSPVNTPMGAVRRVFEIVGTAKVAKSAMDAKDIGYFRGTDGITMNRDRLLYDAKKRALELTQNYVAPTPIEDIRLPGPTGALALDMAVADLKKSGKATPYDVVVSAALARVLSGGSKSDMTVSLKEDDLLKLERDEFGKLARDERTIKRIDHMLSTGKPLRN